MPDSAVLGQAPCNYSCALPHLGFSRRSWGRTQGGYGPPLNDLAPRFAFHGTGRQLAADPVRGNKCLLKDAMVEFLPLDWDSAAPADGRPRYL
jgi:hypothetical protein